MSGVLLKYQQAKFPNSSWTTTNSYFNLRDISGLHSQTILYVHSSSNDCPQQKMPFLLKSTFQFAENVTDLSIGHSLIL